MRTIMATLVLWTLSAGLVFGQDPKYPFPQNIKYPFGYMPTTFATKNLESWYAKYKSQSSLLPKCNSGIAVGTDNGAKVEAMGWAMIIAAYMGDKATFDGLYTFYKSKIQSHGMMAWLSSCGGVSDAGSASDGDLDVAFALLVAYWQWGDSYKEDATKTIETVEKLITDCDGTSVVVGGYGSDGRNPYGGCNQTDISYYTPAFFREFAKFTGNKAWDKLADDTYIVLNNAANDNTGLVPNWHTFAGGQSPQGQYYYGFDACRVPWRIALDYLWNGNAEAKKWCTTISTWAHKTGAKNIKDGYNLDGSTKGSWHNMSYVGGFAVATLCHSQEVANSFGEEVAKMSFDSYWYHAFLGNCYMLAMTGNMWRPNLDSVSTRNVTKKRLPVSAITIKSGTNRELVITGMTNGSNVSLISLAGKRIGHSASTTHNHVSLQVASVKSGCYLLTITNASGTLRENRMVTLY